MEQATGSSLFSLTIDPVTKNHLAETAKWSKFLAIVGMVFVALGLIGVLFFAFYVSSVSNVDGGYGGNMYGGFFPGFGVGLALFYIILLAICFFPLLYLLRFANRMKAALYGNDQQALNTAFLNLKSCLRYVGIFTIIILAFYAIAIIIGIVGVAAFS
jgi:hypothetical protein